MGWGIVGEGKGWLDEGLKDLDEYRGSEWVTRDSYLIVITQGRQIWVIARKARQKKKPCST